MAIGPFDKKDRRDLSKSIATATHIDLGDDLLEKTALSSDSGPSEAPLRPREPARTERDSPSPSPSDEPTPEEIHDRVQSARILYNEGLIEESKKTLRQVLIDDPANAFAKQLLGEIHKLELKQIFGGAPARRNVYAPKDEPGEDLSAIDASRILFRLDQDLSLGFFDGEGAESPVAQLSLFADPKDMERFAVRIDQSLRESPLVERVDVGIGFLEMGLHDLAARQFRFVHKRARPDLELLVSSGALLAYALILSGFPFDATLVLQPILQDHEIALKQKVELFYLMGRAQEMLNKLELAAEWYRQVGEHDPFYRDIEERLRRLARGESRESGA